MAIFVSNRREFSVSWVFCVARFRFIYK
jgi:hypothetical protein